MHFAGTCSWKWPFPYWLLHGCTFVLISFGLNLSSWKRPSCDRAVSGLRGCEAMIRRVMCTLKTGWPIKWPARWVAEHVYLYLDPGLKHHFPRSLRVWLKPITIRHTQAASALCAALTEWPRSTLFQPKFLLEVLLGTSDERRGPFTGGMRLTLRGRDEPQAPMRSLRSPRKVRRCWGPGSVPSAHRWGSPGPCGLLPPLLLPSQD